MRERKVYTGKRGGKYVIVNGEKRYLEKNKSKEKSKSNVKITFEDLKKLAKKNNISTKSESGKNVGKQLTKEKLILKLYRHGINLNKFGKENYNIQPRFKIFNLSCPPCPQCPSIPSCPYNCKCNNNMQPQMMQPLMMQPQMMQPQMMQPQMMQPQMIQQQPTQPTQSVQNNPKIGLEGDKLVRQPEKEKPKLKPEEIKGEGMEGAIKQIKYLQQLMDEDPSLTRAQALKKLKQMDGNKKSPPPPLLDPSKIPTPPPPPPTLDPSKIPKPPPPPPTLDPSKIPTPPPPPPLLQGFGNRKYYKQYYGYYNKKKSFR
jgi:hypothetical protein